MPIPQENKIYTYKDYITWPDDKRYEIINGVPFMLASPTWQHQAISREIMIEFGNYLHNKPCKIFAAPFDLLLPVNDEEKEDVSNVLQPDLLIICDQEKLIKTGYHGIPRLVIEIISPSTARNDKLLKFNLYEKAGVNEYWIIEPEIKLVNVFTLQKNKSYGRPNIYTEKDKINVSVFQDLEIDLNNVFNI